jgi:hypothetical protein
MIIITRILVVTKVLVMVGSISIGGTLLSPFLAPLWESGIEGKTVLIDY